MSGVDDDPVSTSTLGLTPTPSPLKLFSNDNNEFAIALYQAVRQHRKNLFVSPFSVRTVLGMLEAGARGATAAQIKEAMRISDSSETHHGASAQLIQRFNNAGGADYRVVVANSLWAQDGAPVRPDFLDLIDRDYRASVALVDFMRAAEEARMIINRWVEDKTSQKIRELIPSKALTADTRLVLVNAVYFKATWERQFNETLTRSAPFRVGGGGSVDTRLMHQKARFGYMRGAGYQAVELLYRGGDMSMVVLLPDQDDGLDALESEFSPSMLHECVRELSVREVDLFLPRFRITWEPSS